VRLTGVDGCRGGWLAATRADDGAIGWTWTREAAELLHDGSGVVAIDVPIGLPETGTRHCDHEARRLLGRRGVSVFAAPVRPVLGCSTYAEARTVLAARGGASMSAQAFGIVAAVRQVDAALTAADEHRVVEAHPEVAFCLMGGGPGLAGKRTEDGAAARLRLLEEWLPGAGQVLAEAPRPARRDDALDALACLWVARRWAAGEATVLGDGCRDGRGLVMRIVA
jgi:predicted RNase H-like nuclease